MVWQSNGKKGGVVGGREEGGRGRGREEGGCVRGMGRSWAW